MTLPSNVDVAQHRPHVDAGEWAEQGRLGEVPLGEPGEAVQPVVRVGGHTLGERHGVEEVVVGADRRPVEPGCVSKPLDGGCPRGRCGHRAELGT